MTGLQTEYEFTLPKGYVDAEGALHRRGSMRLATARDELEPLRDPRISGPDDPLLTVIVLSRVITSLGTLRQVTPADVEGLFAVDLAFLQDFYGVINFGSESEVADLVAAQRDAAATARPAPPDNGPSGGGPSGGTDGGGRAAVGGRRAAVEEVGPTDR